MSSADSPQPVVVLTAFSSFDGVDAPDELEVVRRIGLPYAQGDAVCPAQSLEELEAIETMEWIASDPLTVTRSDS